MTKKIYSCESESDSEVSSMLNISASTSCSESSSSSTCSSTKSSCSSSSSSECSSNNSSSSNCSSSNSSCSSEPTYSDNSTNKSSESTCESSSSSYVCKKSENLYDKDNYRKCEKLVKKYNCAKEELLAISDIIIVLNFIKSKLQAVQPNIDLRNVDKFNVNKNIEWLECFVDTLFCVLRKNEAYKVIKVKDSKLKNDDENISNRTYLIKIRYNTKDGEVTRNIPLVFKWTQLTNNDAKSFKFVLNYVITDIDNYIKGYQAVGTLPFLCN